MAIKQKAEIRTIGTVDCDDDGQYVVSQWLVTGGDLPGQDLHNGLLGGWNPTELALVAELSVHAGQEQALKVAQRLRPKWIPEQ